MEKLKVTEAFEGADVGDKFVMAFNKSIDPKGIAREILILLKENAMSVSQKTKEAMEKMFQDGTRGEHTISIECTIVLAPGKLSVWIANSMFDYLDNLKIMSIA